MSRGQASVSQTLTQALAGMLDRAYQNEIESKTVAAANTLGIAGGTGLTRVADDTVTGPAAAADITSHFQGIAVRLTAREPHNATIVADGGTGMYVAKDQLPVLREGVIWVPFEAAANQDDPVYCRHTVNGGLNVLGGFANAAGTGLALVTNCKVLDTIAGAGLARVRLGAANF